MYAESEALHEKTVEVIKAFELAIRCGGRIPIILDSAIEDLEETYIRVHGEKNLR